MENVNGTIIGYTYQKDRDSPVYESMAYQKGVLVKREYNLVIVPLKNYMFDGNEVKCIYYKRNSLANYTLRFKRIKDGLTFKIRGKQVFAIERHPGSLK